MQMKLDNYVVLFLAIWSLPIDKNVIQVSCHKPLKSRQWFIEKMGCINS